MHTKILNFRKTIPLLLLSTTPRSILYSVLRDAAAPLSLSLSLLGQGEGNYDGGGWPTTSLFLLSAHLVIRLD